MSMSVNDRVNAIATFRFIEVRLMELLARWTPTTPEMEVKVLFGRHIWDHAQHADILGKRTFELRRPEHHTLRPVDDYVQLLDQVAAVTATDQRLAAFYDGVLVGLHRRYSDYLAATDSILDQPSVVIIERIVSDLERERRDATSLRRELSLDAPSVEHFSAADHSIASIVAAVVPPAERSAAEGRA